MTITAEEFDSRLRAVLIGRDPAVQVDQQTYDSWVDRTPPEESENIIRQIMLRVMSGPSVLLSHGAEGWLNRVTAQMIQMVRRHDIAFQASLYLHMLCAASYLVGYHAGQVKAMEETIR